MFADHAARERALDPTTSFIVQAPAGSGKTELLTQRFLVLLAQVKNAPEEILAITFTRKAAAEMQARILHALQQANTGPAPQTPHARKTWQLARNVLARDAQEQWQLLLNPRRLRIQTIDSLSASLVHQLPVLSQLGPSSTISAEPELLYHQAAQQTLASLEDAAPWSTEIEELLIHLDNDHAKIEKLLSALLAQREQWLPYLTVVANTDDLRAQLESALQHVTREHFEKLLSTIPLETSDALLSIVRLAAENLRIAEIHSPVRACADITRLPGIAVDQRPLWEGLAHMLLTAEGQWRKRITVAEGFPAPSSAKDSTSEKTLRAHKQSFADLLSHYAQADYFRETLHKVRNLPPAHYTPEQWHILRHLLTLLKLLAAQLQLQFQSHGAIDYSEVASRALAALGTADNPTDLALSLDYQMHHILIDEFQDTSAHQFRLIEQLTTGWTPGDGRTLFLVGDPMQSIYRFRKAEVGLFLRAREYGINALPLESLTLQVNFRSSSTIVEWVNRTFSRVLPSNNDISSGAVCYSHAVAAQPVTKNSTVATHFIPPAAEPEKIVRLVQNTLENTSHSIAILVKARPHLQRILPALQAANIPFRATEISPLAQRTVIQDLLTLTRALLHLGDRIAWLALLRAPWCGLNLRDLHCLAQTPRHSTMWEVLLNAVHHPLSPDGQQRVQRIVTILSAHLQDRERLPLGEWIETAWLNLAGPACLTHRTELDDADTFLNLLDEIASSSHGFTLERFTSRLEKHYAAANTTVDIRVEVMSIHKAKGLEFDTVIIPGLGHASRKEDAQLLMWLERPKLHGGADLLLAPIKPAHLQEDPIYRYLRQEDAKKSFYENGRLLYVAATRARHALHLLGYCPDEHTSPKPAVGSLLAHLWDALGNDFLATAEPALNDLSLSTEKKSRKLRRLPLKMFLPPRAAEG